MKSLSPFFLHPFFLFASFYYFLSFHLFSFCDFRVFFLHPFLIYDGLRQTQTDLDRPFASLILLSYSIAAFSANLFGLFYEEIMPNFIQIILHFFGATNSKDVPAISIITP